MAPQVAISFQAGDIRHPLLSHDITPTSRLSPTVVRGIPSVMIRDFSAEVSTKAAVDDGRPPPGLIKGETSRACELLA